MARAGQAAGHCCEHIHQLKPRTRVHRWCTAAAAVGTVVAGADTAAVAVDGVLTVCDDPSVQTGQSRDQGG